MSVFEPFVFDLSVAERELEAFRAWISSRTFVKETEIVRAIAGRRHMCCLLGPTGGILVPDLIKSELTMDGLFRADLVIGNDAKREFVLIEFEGAEATSIFGPGGTAQYRYWSHQIEHGFGQIVDWACLRSNAPNGFALTGTFGGPIAHSAYLVICGRDAALSGDMERARFRYRRQAVRVEGISAQILTYDDMVATMSANLVLIRSYALGPAPVTPGRTRRRLRPTPT